MNQWLHPEPGQTTMRTPIVLIASLLFAPAAGAQTPEADPADVASIDAIMHAVYDVISGPAGQERNWDRFRSLFIPGARLIPTGRAPDGAGRHSVLTVEDFVARTGPNFLANGFFERELGRVQERFGNIVHMMSSYDSKRTAEDAEPFARGVNSFQLWFDGTRWWVVTIFWEAESPGNAIPERFLHRP